MDSGKGTYLECHHCGIVKSEKIVETEWPLMECCPEIIICNSCVKVHGPIDCFTCWNVTCAMYSNECSNCLEALCSVCAEENENNKGTIVCRNCRY